MTRIRSSSTGRVRDRRGSGGMSGASPGALGGLGGLAGGLGGMKAGGGLVGIIVIIAFVVFTQIGGGGESPDSGDAGGAVDCVTEIEQVVCGAVDDVSVYWEGQYPKSFQGAFQGADTVFFSDVVDTGCGRAPAETGPFYCPPDRLIYFDLDFLEQLQREFGAQGDLAAQYIVAHEYGHHVQTITGISDAMQLATQQGDGTANSNSVSLELQADCFAGAWARSVADRGLFDATEEIEEALAAAEAVGDDRILEGAGQDVNPDSFTHGSAEQRRRWFETGFSTGDPERCTTFDGSLAP